MSHLECQLNFIYFKKNQQAGIITPEACGQDGEASENHDLKGAIKRTKKM